MDKSENFQLYPVVIYIIQARRSSSFFYSWKRIFSSQVATMRRHDLRQISHKMIFVLQNLSHFPSLPLDRRLANFFCKHQKNTYFDFVDQDAKLRSLCKILCNHLKIINPFLGNKPYKSRQQMRLSPWAIVCMILAY